ncbi:hypothetical protein YTPLAS18_01620 [Nitrospira sp.]|nr:hypothetical protein YTPLAS18_01620 [Nitrospira sp.]
MRPQERQATLCEEMNAGFPTVHIPHCEFDVRATVSRDASINLSTCVSLIGQPAIKALHPPQSKDMQYDRRIDWIFIKLNTRYGTERGRTCKRVG